MAPTPERRSVVLVAAGSGGAADDLRRLADPAVFEVCFEEDGEVGPAGRPDVVIVPAERAAPLDEGLRGVPVLALIQRDAPQHAQRAVDAGALDVVGLPLIGAEVALRLGAATRVSRAEERLGARNAELTAWAARAGHDLRTPLAVISGMAETLEASWDRLAAADRAQLLASIRNQAGRATAMLDDVLALARQATPPSEKALDGS